jgi:ABC-type antimicrobial peptide transport system permease subunit
MALGAQPSHVLSTVTRQGLRSVLLGVAIGLVAAFALAYALSKILEQMLFEVNVHDPVYFAASPILLVIVAAIACYVPARRATRIEPAITLRTD